MKQSRDGLDVATLGAGPLATLLFRFIRSWRRLEMMNVFGFSRLLNIFAKIQMHSSQAAGLLIAPNQEPISYVWGGELMQRLWHEMTSYGMVLQPMEAIPIFITHLQVKGGENLTTDQRNKLEEMKREFFRLFQLSDQQGLIFFFRAGYAKPMRRRSLRRSVEDFLIST